MKVVSLIGARPQFIKEAILYNEFNKYGIQEIIVNSGQHYDFNMSNVFFQSLNIRNPDYNLNAGSGKHGEMTGKIMIEFEKVVEEVKPDMIIVYGDTNTTLAGAIVGAKLKIPVAHVEAGIRMFPKDMPEEINRALTDRVSVYLFCPSEKAVYNLKREGITDGVFFSGDVMYDLYLRMEEKFKYDFYKQLSLSENEYILMTLHRDYNVDNRYKLEKILQQINKISEKIKVVFTIHPRTQKKIKEFQLTNYLKNLVVLEPLDYLNLMGLTKKAHKIITDSGGLQKEAYFAGKHAIVLMPDTGWVELVEHGCNQLCDENNFYEAVFKDNKCKYDEAIYGNGDAGEKIVSILEKRIRG